MLRTFKLKLNLLNPDGGGGGAPPPAAPPAAPPAEGGGTTPPPAFAWPEKWKDHLPEDIRGEKVFESIQDIPNLAKSFVSAQKLVGKDKIVIPDKHSTPEDWRKNVWEKLGLPAKPEDYALKVDEKLQLDKGFIDKFKEHAFKTGILPQHAQAILDWYGPAAVEAAGQAQEAAKQRHEAGVAELKKEWGDGYATQIRAANLAITEFGGEELIKYLGETGLNADPKLVKLFAKIGSVLKEDELKGGGGRGEYRMTPAEAIAAIGKMRSDATHPLNIADHPNHKAAVLEMSQLYEAAYPDTEKK